MSNRQATIESDFKMSADDIARFYRDAQYLREPATAPAPMADVDFVYYVTHPEVDHLALLAEIKSLYLQ